MIGSIRRSSPLRKIKRILIACEFTGIVREAFKARGWDAWSCDLQPTEILGQHIQGDVTPLLRDRWDIIIAHPPCTFLANSGVCNLYQKNFKKRLLRWCEINAAREFFLLFLYSTKPESRVCVENPTPMPYAKLPRHTQVIQPWMFGHEATKRTLLWLKNLPKLHPTKVVGEGEKHYVNGRSAGAKFLFETEDGRLLVSAVTPEERRNLKSRTFKGIAEAMADQWGNL